MDRCLIPADILVEIANYDPKIYGEMLMLCVTMNIKLRVLSPWELFTYIEYDNTVSYKGESCVKKCRLKQSRLLHGKITHDVNEWNVISPCQRWEDYFRYGIKYKQIYYDYDAGIATIYTMSNGLRHGRAWVHQLSRGKPSTLIRREWYQNDLKVEYFKYIVNKTLRVSIWGCAIFTAYNMFKLLIS
jgi:hypothetical protein